MRTFVAIHIPENIKKEIIKIQKRLPSFEGRLTSPENMHLTLKFLGEVDEKILIEIKRRLKEIDFRDFGTEIKSIGIFDNSKSRKYSRKIIVWLHLTNCNGLQREIDRKLLGIFPREKRFMSHLTIARIRRLKNKKRFLGELNKIKIPLLKFRVKNFCLEKSELSSGGPVYTTLEKYNLG